jgi:predicted transcriptional regulator
MSETKVVDLVRREQRRSRRTVVEIAKALGVHRTTVQRWIAGTSEPAEHLRGEVCRELRCSLSVLSRAIRNTVRTELVSA